MRPLASFLTITTAALLFVLTVAAPSNATTPGQNGRILFAGDVGFGFELYSIKHNGRGFHQLTNLYGDETAADWSPDGRKIVFEHDFFRNGRDHGQIVIMYGDGSGLQAITTGGIKHQPAFTPDGDHIVYECECHPDGIFIMQVDGSDRRRLSTNPFKYETDTDPDVSPDGQTVTFVRHKVDGLLQALYAVDINGGAAHKLVRYSLEVAIKHDWAPDGSRILITPYADYPDGRSPNVATVNPDGTGLQRLTHYTGGAVGAFAGSFSPNGRWIVFRSENLSSQTYRLWKMGPDGTDRTLIDRLPFAPRSIDWGEVPPS